MSRLKKKLVKQLKRRLLAQIADCTAIITVLTDQVRKPEIIANEKLRSAISDRIHDTRNKRVRLRIKKNKLV